MKILYISPINTVGTLELWKQFHESNGHQCTYITLFKSPLGVDSGVCLNLPLVAHSNKMIALRRIYYKIIKGIKESINQRMAILQYLNQIQYLKSYISNFGIGFGLIQLNQ